MRSGPKQVVQIPKKKTCPPPKQSSNQTQEKRPNQGDPYKVVETEEVNKNVHNLILKMSYVRSKFQYPLLS